MKSASHHLPPGGLHRRLATNRRRDGRDNDAGGISFRNGAAACNGPEIVLDFYEHMAASARAEMAAQRAMKMRCALQPRGAQKDV